LIPENSLELIPGSQNLSSNHIEEVEDLSTNSLSFNDKLDSFRLIRSRSNSSSFSNTGYLFLAIVFCMMCCSSYIVSPTNVLKLATQTQGFSSIFSAFNSGKGLKFSATKNEDYYASLNNLAGHVDNDV
jgi:hypothetical protein